MEKSPETPVIPPNSKIQHDRLIRFFLMHLNLIYCAKSYLIKQLPEIEEIANFKDLKFAVAETTDSVTKQITRMREIYDLLDAEVAIESRNGITGMVEDAFLAIKQHKDDPWLRDMAILYYILNIESIEMASFQVLYLTASKLKDVNVKQLVKENYDEAKEDRALMILLTTKYLNN